MTAFETCIGQLIHLRRLNEKLLSLSSLAECTVDWDRVKIRHEEMQEVQRKIWMLQKQIYGFDIGETVWLHERNSCAVIVHREINQGLPLDKCIFYVVRFENGEEYVVPENALKKQ